MVPVAKRRGAAAARGAGAVSQCGGRRSWTVWWENKRGRRLGRLREKIMIETSGSQGKAVRHAWMISCINHPVVFK